VGDAEAGSRSGDAVAVFAAAVRRLFAAAGSPTVAQVAREVGVSAGTVSHWRTGRHLPSDFAVIEPMLVWLTSHTSDSTAAVGGAAGGRVAMWQWRGLFEAALGRDAVSPVLGQIAAAAQVWADQAEAHDATVAVGQARRVLLDCVEIAATGHAAPRTSRLGAHTNTSTDAGAGGGTEVAGVVAALLDLGVLSVDADGRVGLVDMRLVNLWPHLAQWVREGWQDLSARTGLEHDAQRWEAAGRPRELLYDHRRIELAADALIALNHSNTPTPGEQADENAGRGERFRFGGAASSDVPAAARDFWAASQAEALYRLRVDQIIMALLVTLAVMVLGLGFTLAAVT
jgi:hypothetical protein